MAFAHWVVAAGCLGLACTAMAAALGSPWATRDLPGFPGATLKLPGENGTKEATVAPTPPTTSSFGLCNTGSAQRAPSAGACFLVPVGGALVGAGSGLGLVAPFVRRSTRKVTALVLAVGGLTLAVGALLFVSGLPDRTDLGNLQPTAAPFVLMASGALALAGSRLLAKANGFTVRVEGRSEAYCVACRRANADLLLEQAS